MAIEDLIYSFRPRRRVRIGVRGTFGLTQLGKVKVDELGVEGPPWEILSYLDEHGPSSLSEIAEGTHLSDEKVKTVTNKLIRAGYIRKVQQEQ